MSNDDGYLRKRKPFNYDERDPEILDNSSLSDSDTIVYIPEKEANQQKSKKSDSDDDQYIPENSPAEMFDDFDLKSASPERHKKTHTKRTPGFTIPPIVSEKTSIQAFSPALIQRLKRSSKDPSVRKDPQGNPCPYVSYSEVEKNILHPEVLFKNCQGFNTLMPEYDPTSADKLQFFNLDCQIPVFSFDYIRSLTDESLDAILEDNSQELEKLDDLALDNSYIVPPFDEKLTKSVPIRANVLTFDWKGFGEKIQFDVILMDPPWIIQPKKMTRGVELGYDQMPENDIASMPLNYVQKDGYIFMWVVAKEFSNGLRMLELWGYEVINSMHWIKTSRKGIYFPSNGYYLLHTKETLLIGVKGKGVEFMRPDKFNDLIVQPRNLRQSHKPNHLYKMIESIFPNGKYLEIFARAHNLRKGWVSLGLEIPS